MQASAKSKPMPSPARVPGQSHIQALNLSLNFSVHKGTGTLNATWLLANSAVITGTLEASDDSVPI